MIPLQYATITFAFFIKESESSKSGYIFSLKMPPQGVFIVWEWLLEDDVDHALEIDSKNIRSLSPSVDSELQQLVLSHYYCTQLH